MDLLSKAITSLEHAIRYLLTGAVVTSLFVFSRSDYKDLVASVENRDVTTAVIAVLVGMATFSLYRLFLWTVGDIVAWKFKWSAPSSHEGPKWAYDRPYTKFLWWRHAGHLTTSISDYLTYRWSIAHFATISGVGLLVADLCAQENSAIANYDGLATGSGIMCGALGLWQCSFLWRVERNLQDGAYSQK
ncbi:MAG: hypothetical protein ACT4P0_06805 [Panacagrimonas sp.]